MITSDFGQELVLFSGVLSKSKSQKTGRNICRAVGTACGCSQTLRKEEICRGDR